MRIAQVAPLFESVPPKYYGGTERVVSYLTEELVQQGHDVTLFASGDAVTSARLISPCPQSLRLDATCIDQMAHHIVLLEQVFQHASRFDIIHFHGAEMQRHLQALLADKAMARELAEHGRQTILSRHTCAHRVDELLAIHAELARARREAVVVPCAVD